MEFGDVGLLSHCTWKKCFSSVNSTNVSNVLEKSTKFFESTNLKETIPMIMVQEGMIYGYNRQAKLMF
jgi:hypothetical protein